MTHLKPVEILERAKEFLQCAEYALENNLLSACAICSYAALFWTARAALAREGFNPPTWGHSELRLKFTKELVTIRNRYPRNFNAWLANAYALRNAAQYHFIPPKAKKVRRMVNHSKEFIRKTKERLK